MTSTEQKNVTQPLISCCFTFGLMPTIITGAFDRYTLETESPPFTGMDATYELGQRIRSKPDPFDDLRTVIPTVRTAPLFTRLSPFLLQICSPSDTYSGNQAVIRMAEGIISNRWGMHFRTTDAVKHACKYTAKVCGMLSPGAYGQVRRTATNVRKIGHQDSSFILRNAADAIDRINKAGPDARYNRELRSWCRRAQKETGFRYRYRKNEAALEAYRQFDPSAIHAFEEPPAVKQKWYTVSRESGVKVHYYQVGSLHFFRVQGKYGSDRETTLGATKASTKRKRYSIKKIHELYVMSSRDMKDLQFLLHAASHIKLYNRRRMLDIDDKGLRNKVENAHSEMWKLYLDVLRVCGIDQSLRNKLGVYFDVLQWRYLAWRSGDLFYDHSSIMAQKIESKNLSSLPTQDHMLALLRDLPMDIAIDMTGMYKASIYPEVDPYQVVCDQYRLHMNRHITDWDEDSPERARFNDTKAYMWYLGIKVLNVKNGTWPGKIRTGVEEKDWHTRYKARGIPPSCWRDAHDVDLTGAVTVADISNEQYLRQQDSACAPPLWEEYQTFEAIKTAPRKHRRKILYAIQENPLPDLPKALAELNEIGLKLPEAYVGEVEYHPEFSTHIVTGSRCERHKDAPRPFYAASPPWGCIISYIDGITRDFLNNVPQSMLGKSTRQKFLDLSSVTSSKAYDMHAFYMSDDKAKYSPHMDPQSQQLPADFFAELFDIPAIKAYGPVMYHCELYYRVNGHLVHYNSNGTDREGMRGASNTWLEVVAQGLSTRLCREKGWVKDKSLFLSFIDDGLRKFAIQTKGLRASEHMGVARRVIEDVIFGLKVLGRELSWDKTFISQELFVILNEIVYDGAFISSGLKSFCTAGDLEMKEVMSAADYEQLYFGKMRGAHGVGTPLDICHYVYVFETLTSHYKMGVTLQNQSNTLASDYIIFCMTPISLGGGGIRSMLQMGCNEVANATKEGIGCLIRMSHEIPITMILIANLLNNVLDPVSPVDFMREPEQIHVSGPRIRTQRMTAEVRKCMRNIASNPLSITYMEQDRVGLEVLGQMGKALMAIGDVSAEEVRLLYSSSPVAFIDEFVQKLASSTTLAELLGRTVISSLRRQVRRDLIAAVSAFGGRLGTQEVISSMTKEQMQLEVHRFLFG